MALVPGSCADNQWETGSGFGTNKHAWWCLAFGPDRGDSGEEVLVRQPASRRLRGWGDDRKGRKKKSADSVSVLAQRGGKNVGEKEELVFSSVKRNTLVSERHPHGQNPAVSLSSRTSVLLLYYYYSLLHTTCFEEICEWSTTWNIVLKTQHQRFPLKCFHLCQCCRSGGWASYWFGVIQIYYKFSSVTMIS